MTGIAEERCIPFTEYTPNNCWKKADARSDPSSVFWITLPTCTGIPTVLVVNKSEVTEFYFAKMGSLIRVKDNCIWYRKGSLVGKKNLHE